jgi:hypothetical protein
VTGGREAPARPYSMSTCRASRGSIPRDASRPKRRRRALLMPDPISGTAEPKPRLNCRLPIALRGRGLRGRNRSFQTLSLWAQWASAQRQAQAGTRSPRWTRSEIHGLKPHGPWPRNGEAGSGGVRLASTVRYLEKYTRRGLAEMPIEPLIRQNTHMNIRILLQCPDDSFKACYK